MKLPKEKKISLEMEYFGNDVDAFLLFESEEGYMLFLEKMS